MRSVPLLASLFAVASGKAALPRNHALWVRGGSDGYAAACDQAYQNAISGAQAELSKFSEEIESGSCVVDFGAKSDAVLAAAMQGFAASAPSPADASDQKMCAAKAAAVEGLLEPSLRVLYMKQLLLLREKALARYKVAAKASENSDYEAMIDADAFFGSEAEASTRAGWDYSAERASLQATMNEVARAKKRLADTKLAAAKAQQEIMKLLQTQHSQIQQLQQVAYGTATPLNLGLAYRVPDTNINLSVGHQQGRTNVQLSCVPDESAPLLGPNGFTRGVGPGNLGVSVSLTV
eukprot:CAMPEP_0172616986 /NCGR_PEP_ID=MMETSP1068-20121228/69313_1 /TAXON_ID=35684 /ORGANISM="Pseudopedinella elastica, Strain CCMP716" /LENGTH=292 /DNA_ID=CAMNT_0013422625 /DNA_START=33 /DNA_END=911 /DNA_ORIENTATION=-